MVKSPRLVKGGWINTALSACARQESAAQWRSLTSRRRRRFKQALLLPEWSEFPRCVQIMGDDYRVIIRRESGEGAARYEQGNQSLLR